MTTVDVPGILAGPHWVRTASSSPPDPTVDSLRGGLPMFSSTLVSEAGWRSESMVLREVM